MDALSWVGTVIKLDDFALKCGILAQLSSGPILDSEDGRKLSREPTWTTRVRAYLAAFLTAAQRLRCASAIRLRPAGLNFRFAGRVADFLPRVLEPESVSSARARSRRAISESIVERTSFRLMRDSVRQSRTLLQPALRILNAPEVEAVKARSETGSELSI